MCEQTPVRQLVEDVVTAEQAGFDFAVMSDHYFPWLEEQGHSAYVWSVLGAAAQATTHIPLMTYVTCPSFRYHPAVVAQKAATMGVLSSGRFTLGLGAGENLNEHVIGGAWPVARTRQERLKESVQIIRELFTGEYVNFSGRHFTVERARLFDLPDSPVKIGIAASADGSLQLAVDLADCLITAEPDAGLASGFFAAGGEGKPAFTQVPLCYDQDEEAARERARRLWRWSTAGWYVMSELPEPRSFDAASQSVTADDIAETVPCGPDLARHVDAVKKAVDAGFTHIALVQIGSGHQGKFAAWAESELLPALRQLG
jgi:G6PDH family F420-dependent oxidoreductase